MARRHARPAAVARVTCATRPLARHEQASLDAMAASIAALLHADHAAVVDVDQCRADAPCYFVPDDTLDAAQAGALGIRDADALFGGVVPHRFVATKVVSHPLVHAGADAPDGWVAGLGNRLAGAVLPGLAVFTVDDARRAAAALLPLGNLRLKLGRGVGGHGQALVRDRDALEVALAALPVDELQAHGATLEQDLGEACTRSIGTACCGDIAIAYIGTQRTTHDRQGNVVYGGSDLDVVRGGFDALARLPLAGAAAHALQQAMHYDSAMQACFPGFFASRRNYDLVAGRDARGDMACGVLEQSWRIGGATPAELVAMQAFAADPALQRVRTSCREVHGDYAPPPAATVFFHGDDPELGPLCKYAVRSMDAHA